MSEAQALELARRRLTTLLDEHSRDALAACAAEDPLRLEERAALAADDDGLLFDPNDLMIDGYVALTRERRWVDDLTGWLEVGFRKLVASFGAEPPSPALTACLGRTLGLDDEKVEAWAEALRTLQLADRRDVLALLRTGSQSLRTLLPGRTFDVRRDIVAIQRAYGLLRGLLARAVR